MIRGKWFGLVIGAAALLSSAAADAQVVALASGFLPDPRTVSGMAGGPVQASMMSGTCRGAIPPVPQHRVVLQTPMPFFRVWVNSATDTTLLVRAPNGQIFCADDTWGVNPGVDILGAMPGQYEVFVGTYSAGAVAPYLAGFSELRTSTPTAAGAAQPVMIAPPPQNPCGGGGYVPPGNPCGGGGAYVGPPQQGGFAMPPGGFRAGYPLASGFLPDPRMFSGISGGPIAAMSMNASCRGYINGVPNHTIQLTTPFNFLRVWVRSQGDTTLFVRAPTGQVFCADDTWGLNPGVDLNGLPPGQYQVYVGSYSPQARSPYELAVTEMPSSTPMVGGVPMAGPVVAQPPPPMNNYGAVSLMPGFVPDPQMRTGISGGPLSAMSMNSACRGYMATQPNHVVYLAAPFNYLRVYVSSQSDTTMMIRGPNGEVWCADDTFGLNPAIDLTSASPGAYQIFVGSYAAGNQSPYSIGFTENPGIHP